MSTAQKVFDYDALDDGVTQDIQWAAPQIGSALTPLNLNVQDQGINCGWVFQWDGSALGALYGARKPLPAARDISARRFLWVAAFTPGYATVLKFADLADGGVRFYLTDSAGAYRGYTLYGRDVSGSNPNPPFAFGSYIAFSNSPSQMWWCIDLDRTPDYSSGTLDLTDIVAIEAHVQNNASITNTADGRAAFGYILASGDSIIRAGDVGDAADFTLLPQNPGPWNPSYNPLYPGGSRQGQGQTPIYDGANGNTYATIPPVHVGDGSTATYFRQGRGTLSAQLSMAAIKHRIAQGETPALLPCYLPDDAGDRTHTINQSADCDVEIRDFTWSGFDVPGGDYAVEVTGSASGRCAFIGNTFARAQFVRLRHGAAVACIFDGCGPVEITAASTLTGCTIRNARPGSTALVVAGGPGDYAGVDVLMDSPLAARDVAVGAGGAGLYDLSGLRLPAGRALRLHNPTDAPITVALSAGIVAEVSGGPITIEQPRPVQSVSVSNGIPGTLLLIEDVGGAAPQTLYLGRPDAWPLVWTDPAPYAADRLIRIRAMYAEGTEATLFIDQIAGSATEAAPALPFRLNQQMDAVHAANGIDGAAVTGVVFDDGAARIRCTRSTLSLPELYAAEAAFRATEAGITGTGRLLAAPDPANYLLAGARLRNDGAVALMLTGGYLRAAEGQAIDAIDAGGGTVVMAPDHVVAYALAADGSGSGGSSPAVVAGAVREQLAPELARINALPEDVASHSGLLAAIEEASLL